MTRDAEMWVNGFLVIGATATPFLLAWATAVLWRRSRSPWALGAALGAAVAVVGIVGVWAGFFVHYSSTETMMAENADTSGPFKHALTLLPVPVGCLIAALALVGYARSLPRNLP